MMLLDLTVDGVNNITEEQYNKPDANMWLLINKIEKLFRVDEPVIEVDTDRLTDALVTIIHINSRTLIKNHFSFT
jgi:hypothetical protein